MKVRLERRFQLEAAHLLPRLPQGHKCRRLHGHSYRVRLVVAGEVDPELGWLMDFEAIDEAFEPVRDQLDHRYLNEVSGLDNPTAENIARWIWVRMVDRLPLVEVRVEETCEACCIYRGQ